ncbi:metal-dependent transcriptional regulator [Propioniciclava sp. MC1595]|uniref:metal-dependent transcriptional regulator n=1 Tax=unclassified Propioniciclava TaxID=2642922 RepID=UPI001604397C|nr:MULTISPECIES: metal-dependent transcriptional regulator [unclassified Propioniciclava]MBB1494889.1 metal-dependent transcriptional regulator [Propioniciclava sp. MC1595]MBB1501400.1 metal-dependent transcriptional regulator [Propioniciclava sp. MC1683]QTE25510.1 metal-dependent transcriptional regulator [Propioniciclava sp. MC1595]
MSDLIDTTEMYLRTVYELEEEGVPPLRARIAERLAQSGPTVSQTVQRMERDGLLRVADDRTIELTEVGRAKATSVMRKHRLAEVLLTEVIGLPLELVHEEACRWEHVISDAVEERIVAILDAPSRSPYGNPIPGRGAIGPSGPEADGVRTLASALAGTGEGSVVVERLTEVIQSDAELIALLQEAGVRPGRTVNAELDGTVLRLVGEGGVPHTVEAEVAHHLFVRS